MIEKIDDEIYSLRERINILEQENQINKAVINNLNAEIQKINKEDEKYKKRKRNALLIMAFLGVMMVIIYYAVISYLMKDLM